MDIHTNKYASCIYLIFLFYSPSLFIRPIFSLLFSSTRPILSIYN